MSAASQCIDVIAEATGKLHGTVFRAARSLRVALLDGVPSCPASGMWPQGSQGRGRAAEPSPQHLAYLALGLAADPIVEAPAVALRYANLVTPSAARVRARPIGAGKGEAFNVSAYCGNGEPLVAEIASLIEALAVATAGQRDAFRHSGFSICLVLGSYVSSAEASYRLLDTAAPVAVPYLPVQGLSGAEPQPLAPIVHHVILPATLILVMAELWGDTARARAARDAANAAKAKRKRRTLPLPTSAGDVSSTAETAATRVLQGTNAAAPNDRAEAQADASTRKLPSAGLPFNPNRRSENA